MPAKHLYINRAYTEDDDEVNYDNSFVYNNIEHVNRYFEHYLTEEEILPDALNSYYVDYYLAQLENGGFSQFVYNSGWHSHIVSAIRRGMKDMGAKRHSALFEEAAALFDRMSDEEKTAFFESGYFGDNQERDLLDQISDRIFQLNEEEDLWRKNEDFLRRHPKLTLVGREEFEKILEAAQNALPDLAERQKQAAENAPRYYKIIDLLCREAGQSLDRITAGDYCDYEGREMLAWHFITDRGHYYMVDLGDTAVMVNGESGKAAAQADISRLPQD